MQIIDMFFLHILPHIHDIIQLMHSFEVDIRICQPENSYVTEAKPR